MSLTSAHFIGIIGTLILISAVGIYAGRKVKSAADFSTGGRRASALIVSGIIMGTLVGGASTIGTAQLAFQYGFAAWWFTLGSGIGCLILGVGMVRILWESSVETVPQFLVKTYGDSIGPITSVFTTIGMFLSLMAQILSFCALFVSIYPINPIWAASIGIILTLGYVLFGGIWGAGLTGIVKLILLYISMLSCGVLAFQQLGGVDSLMTKFPLYPWFSLFGRGLTKDLAAGVSLIVGVLSTQIYFQAVLSGKSIKDARLGALISAVMIPPVGICGILVGLYMRANFPETPSSEVLPVFILTFLSPAFAGVVIATLLISVVATAVGLTLGMSTQITQDLYKRFYRPQADSSQILLVQRGIMIALCAITLFFVSSNSGSLILNWSFMAFGLRGSAVLFPLFGAMVFPQWVVPKAGIAAAVLGPLANFLWKIIYPTGLDPLYPGLLISLMSLIIGSMLFKPVRTS
jgi:SSS family solute:Na+ symporter